MSSGSEGSDEEPAPLITQDSVLSDCRDALQYGAAQFHGLALVPGSSTTSALPDWIEYFETHGTDDAEEEALLHTAHVLMHIRTAVVGGDWEEVAVALDAASDAPMDGCAEEELHSIARMVDLQRSLSVLRESLTEGALDGWVGTPEFAELSSEPLEEALIAVRNIVDGNASIQPYVSSCESVVATRRALRRCAWDAARTTASEALADVPRDVVEAKEELEKTITVADDAAAREEITQLLVEEWDGSDDCCAALEDSLAHAEALPCIGPQTQAVCDAGLAVLQWMRGDGEDRASAEAAIAAVPDLQPYARKLLDSVPDETEDDWMKPRQPAASLVSDDDDGDDDDNRQGSDSSSAGSSTRDGMTTGPGFLLDAPPPRREVRHRSSDASSDADSSAASSDHEELLTTGPIEASALPAGQRVEEDQDEITPRMVAGSSGEQETLDNDDDQEEEIEENGLVANVEPHSSRDVGRSGSSATDSTAAESESPPFDSAAATTTGPQLRSPLTPSQLSHFAARRGKLGADTRVPPSKQPVARATPRGWSLHCPGGSRTAGIGLRRLGIVLAQTGPIGASGTVQRSRVRLEPLDEALTDIVRPRSAARRSRRKHASRGSSVSTQGDSSTEGDGGDIFEWDSFGIVDEDTGEASVLFHLSPEHRQWLETEMDCVTRQSALRSRVAAGRIVDALSSTATSSFASDAPAMMATSFSSATGNATTTNAALTGEMDGSSLSLARLAPPRGWWSGEELPPADAGVWIRRDGRSSPTGSRDESVEPLRQGVHVTWSARGWEWHPAWSASRRWATLSDAGDRVPHRTEIGLTPARQTRAVLCFVGLLRRARAAWVWGSDRDLSAVAAICFPGRCGAVAWTSEDNVDEEDGIFTGESPLHPARFLPVTPGRWSSPSQSKGRDLSPSDAHHLGSVAQRPLAAWIQQQEKRDSSEHVSSSPAVSAVYAESPDRMRTPTRRQTKRPSPGESSSTSAALDDETLQARWVARLRASIAPLAAAFTSGSSSSSAAAPSSSPPATGQQQEVVDEAAVDSSTLLRTLPRSIALECRVMQVRAQGTLALRLLAHAMRVHMSAETRHETEEVTTRVHPKPSAMASRRTVDLPCPWDSLPSRPALSSAIEFAVEAVQAATSKRSQSRGRSGREGVATFRELGLGGKDSDEEGKESQQHDGWPENVDWEEEAAARAGAEREGDSDEGSDDSHSDRVHVRVDGVFVRGSPWKSLSVRDRRSRSVGTDEDNRSEGQDGLTKVDEDDEDLEEEDNTIGELSDDGEGHSHHHRRDPSSASSKSSFSSSAGSLFDKAETTARVPQDWVLETAFPSLPRLFQTLRKVIRVAKPLDLAGSAWREGKWSLVQRHARTCRNELTRSWRACDSVLATKLLQRSVRRFLRAQTRAAAVEDALHALRASWVQGRARGVAGGLEGSSADGSIVQEASQRLEAAWQRRTVSQDDFPPWTRRRMTPSHTIEQLLAVAKVVVDIRTGLAARNWRLVDRGVRQSLPADALASVPTTVSEEIAAAKNELSLRVLHFSLSKSVAPPFVHATASSSSSVPLTSPSSSFKASTYIDWLRGAGSEAVDVLEQAIHRADHAPCDFYLRNALVSLARGVLAAREAVSRGHWSTVRALQQSAPESLNDWKPLAEEMSEHDAGIPSGACAAAVAEWCAMPQDTTTIPPLIVDCVRHIGVPFWREWSYVCKESVRRAEMPSLEASLSNALRVRRRRPLRDALTLAKGFGLDLPRPSPRLLQEQQDMMALASGTMEQKEARKLENGDTEKSNSPDNGGDFSTAADRAVRMAASRFVDAWSSCPKSDVERQLEREVGLYPSPELENGRRREIRRDSDPHYEQDASHQHNMSSHLGLHDDSFGAFSDRKGDDVNLPLHANDDENVNDDDDEEKDPLDRLLQRVVDQSFSLECASEAIERSVHARDPILLERAVDLARAVGLVPEDCAALSRAERLRSQADRLREEAASALSRVDPGAAASVLQDQETTGAVLPDRVVASLRHLKAMDPTEALMVRLRAARASGQEDAAVEATMAAKEVYLLGSSAPSPSSSSLQSLASTPGASALHANGKDQKRWEALAHGEWALHRYPYLRGVQSPDLLETVTGGTLTFASRPMSHPLTMLESAEQEEIAVQTFRSIMGFMGDLPVPDPDALGTTVVQLGRAHPWIRDELLLQVVKQLQHNPRPESCHRGWVLCLALLRSFPAPTALENFLEVFFRRRGRWLLVEAMHRIAFRWSQADSSEVYRRRHSNKDAEGVPLSATEAADRVKRAQEDMVRASRARLAERLTGGQQLSNDDSSQSYGAERTTAAAVDWSVTSPRAGPASLRARWFIQSDPRDSPSRHPAAEEDQPASVRHGGWWDETESSSVPVSPHRVEFDAATPQKPHRLSRRDISPATESHPSFTLDVSPERVVPSETRGRVGPLVASGGYTAAFSRRRSVDRDAEEAFRSPSSSPGRHGVQGVRQRTPAHPTWEPAGASSASGRGSISLPSESGKAWPGVESLSGRLQQPL